MQEATQHGLKTYFRLVLDQVFIPKWYQVFIPGSSVNSYRYRPNFIITVFDWYVGVQVPGRSYSSTQYIPGRALLLPVVSTVGPR